VTRFEGRAAAGGTPLIRLARFAPVGRLFGKSEFMLPSGSTFDRISAAQLDADPELVAKGAVVAGSGSQCLAFAAAAAVRGIPLVAVCPSNTLGEHRILLDGYPCEVIGTDAELGVAGADAEAEVQAARRGARLLFSARELDRAIDQFADTLGAELVEDARDALARAAGEGAPLAVVGPIGKGAVVGGIRRAFARAGLEALFFGTTAADDRVSLQDGVSSRSRAPALPSVALVEVSDEQAYLARMKVARTEGLLIGLASAGALSVAAGLLERGVAQTAIAVLVDAGDRYFSRDTVLKERAAP
jgi:cysteine synthase